MEDLIYTVAPEIFSQHPGYTRGVVLAYDVRNNEPSDRISAMLRMAEQEVRERLTLQDLVGDPHFASWREAYRRFGSKPSEFRPSMEAMIRRVLKGQTLPSINPLVDIGNIISLRHLLPVGVHAIDQLSTDLALRLATGSEEFTPFGENIVEHPLPGEIVFAEGNYILTRRWTWRQANRTITLPESCAVEFNIDGLFPVTPKEVADICEEVCEMIVRFCGGMVHHEMLSEDNNYISLSR